MMATGKPHPATQLSNLWDWGGRIVVICQRRRSPDGRVVESPGELHELGRVVSVCDDGAQDAVWKVRGLSTDNPWEAWWPLEGVAPYDGPMLFCGCGRVSRMHNLPRQGFSWAGTPYRPFDEAVTPLRTWCVFCMSETRAG